MEYMQSGKNSEFTLDPEGALKCHNRLCVPNLDDLRRVILEKAHNSKHTIYPGSAKMYQDLK